MIMPDSRSFRVAILDLYDGQPNEGMRCIRQILDEFAQEQQLRLTRDEFDVRGKREVPGMQYDVYISSGGPGSPLESEGSAWERVYFEWLAEVERWNARPGEEAPKEVFFICHSFQLVSRYWRIGEVCARRSTAFGVFPVHILPAGRHEAVFEGLDDPFYVVDSRDYQVIYPDYRKLRQMGASMLCIEKERPHVPLERAIMGIRFNRHMIGTQFHPEADAEGMSRYLQREDKKKSVIENHGEAKWQSMIEGLNDASKIRRTYRHVLPNFLRHALEIPVSSEY